VKKREPSGPPVTITLNPLERVILLGFPSLFSMKMLFVVHYPVFGGPHNQALRLNKLLLQHGWETIVLIPDEGGNAAQRLTSGKVEVVQMALHRLRARWSLRAQLDFFFGFWPDVNAIRRLLRERGVDLILIGGLINPQAAIAAWLEGLPVVWQILDTRAPRFLRRLFIPLVKGLADSVMCTGVEVAQAHPGVMALDDRLVPYFPPVDTVEFRPDPERRAQARVELGVPEDCLLIGAVGNLNPEKGHENLIEAGSIIQREIPNLHIRILGANTSTHLDYLARLNEKAKALGFTKDNRFRIVQPEGRVSELLPALDIFLLTSRSEGIPTVILEAMSCGLPVVATDVGSVREIVHDGLTGFVVPALDPRAIANRVVQLLNNAELRKNMGVHARVHAVEKYDAKICADTHIRAFELARAYHSHKRRKGMLPRSRIV